MRNGLPGKENLKFFGSLKSIVLFVGLFVFGGISQNAYSQQIIDVYTSACAGGFITGEELMDAGGVPSGHRDGGTWIETDGLDFSDFGRNPIIDGFALGDYTIEWQRTPSKIYNFHIDVDNTASSFTLENEAGTTSDVITSAATYDFSVTPVPGATYVFYEKQMPDGTLTIVPNGTNNVYQYSASGNVDQIYAVVTEPGGCQVMTNAIEISTGALDLRVEGGQSICDGSFGFDLYVRPFDPNLNYAWEYDDGTGWVVVDDPPVAPYDITTVGGAGDYRAFVYNGTYSNRQYESDIVTVQNYQLPEVTIDPSGFAALCDPSVGITLEGTMAGPHVESVSYEWLTNGIPGNTGDISSAPYTNTNTVYSTGEYDFKVYETNNPLCFRSATESVTVVEPTATMDPVGMGVCGPVEPSFLVEIIGQTGDDWTVAISDGTTTYTEVISDADGDGTASGTINWGTVINTSTSYSLSVSSASGCSITNLPGSVVFEIYELPLIYSVSGSGCVGDNIQIDLSDSESDVNYELLDPTGTVIDDQNGTGAAISFNVAGAIEGDYEIRGTRGSCSEWMNGVVSVGQPPTSTLGVSLTGPGCSGTSHTITVALSESDVYYSLYNGTTEVRSPRPGNGGDLDFSGVTAAGTYTVYAERNGCGLDLDQTVSIAQTPLAQTISTPEGCEGTDLYVDLSDSQVGYEYTLYDAPDGSGNLIETIPGDGDDVSFSIPINIDGTYSVIASNPGSGCIRDLGDVVIHDTPDLSFTLSTPSSPVCSGLSHVMTLSGSENGINYRLYRDDTSGTPVDIQTGDGINPLNFSAQSEAGTYLVTAETNGCEYDLTGTQVVINKQPQQFSINSSNACVGDNVTITLANSEDGVTYVLTRNNVPYGTSLSGSAGSPINFGPEEFPQGAYEVEANAGGCTADMLGTVNVNALPNVYINSLNSDYCANSGSVTISGGPTTGTNSWGVQGYTAPNPSWFTDNGDETATFNVDDALASSGDGAYSIYYLYEDPTTGCQNGDTAVTNFHADLANNLEFHYRSSTAAAGDPWTDFPAGDLTVCEGDGPIDLEGYFVNTNNPVADGTFSGPGVTDNGGNGTAEFDPAVAGNGNHTITYTYTDPVTTCTGTVTHTIQIGTSLEFNGLNSIYCATDGVINVYGDDLAGTGISGTLEIFDDPTSPVTPIYSQTNNSSSNTFPFDPSSEGPGDYLFRFTYNDGTCDNTFDQEVTVAATLDPSFTTASGLTQFCETQGLVELVPTQTGGVFTVTNSSGTNINAISGYNFDPSSPAITAGETYTITYTIDTGNCTASETLDVTVVASPSINIDGLAAEYCDDETGPFLIEPNNPGIAGAEYTFSTTVNAIGRSPLYYDNGTDTTHVASQTFTGAFTEQFYFDPAHAGYGTYTVTYTFDNSANTGCIATVSETVVVNETRSVNFAGTTDPIEYCQSDAPVTLEGSFTSGGLIGEGNFSGAGIDNLIVNDGLAEFDPSTVIPGDHPILYVYSDPVTGCDSERTKTFTVKETPTIYNVTPNTSTTTYPGNFCPGDDVEIGVDDSQDDVDYELILNGNVASPVETIPGDATAGAIFFTPVDVPGDYTVRAVWNTPSGCPQWMNGTVEVRQNNVTASVTKQDVLCNSDNSGEIVVSASGGTAPYVYQISDDGGSTYSSQASNTFSSLDAGTYDIQVVDELSCQLPASIEVTISEPTTALSVSLSSTPIGCTGETDGQASATISGGVPFTDLTTYPSGYDVEWTDDSGNTVAASVGDPTIIENQAAGAYTVTITDANGCVVSDVVTVGTVPSIVLTEDSHSNVTCNGGSNGEIVVSATGGQGIGTADYQFSLDQSNWFSADSGDPDDNTRTFSNLSAGNYNVYVRDANYPDCEYNLGSPITITQPTVLSVVEVVASHQDVTCFGDDDGSFEVQASGGTSPYEYSFDGGVNFSSTKVSSGLSGGAYNVIARDDNGCTVVLSSPVVINEPDELVIDSYSVSNVKCTSGIDGSISVTAIGGNGNYVYSLAGTEARPNQASPVFNNLSAGTYNVTVTDDESCSATYNNIVVSEPTTALSVTLSSTPIGCTGETDGQASATISGGVPFTDLTTYPSGYLVEWTDDSGNPVGASGDGTIIENLDAGDYTVTITDANGCVVSDVVTVGVVPVITLSEISRDNIDCHGSATGSFTVQASGGTSTASYQFSLDQNNWFSPDASDATQRTFTGLSSGISYTVYVRDANYPNCDYALGTPIVLSEPNELTISEILGSHADVDCYGNSTGQFEVEANGGTAPYTFSLNGGTFSGDSLFTGLYSGSYSVTVQDSEGCTATLTAPVEITQPPQLQITDYTVSNVSCNLGDDGRITVTASGGDGNYVYSLSGTVSRPNQTSGTFNNLENGSYDVTVTDGSGCLTSYTGIEVDEPSSPIVLSTAIDQNVLCRGGNTGAFIVTASGGTGDFEFSIDGGTNWNTDNTNSYTFDNLSAGTYTVDVRDANVCIESTTETISQPDSAFVLTASVANHVSCYDGNDGSISVSGIGGASSSGVDYVLYRDDAGSWVPQGSADETNSNPAFTGLNAGDYRIVAYDDNGCSDSQNLTINEPTAEISFTDDINNVTTPGGNDGSIEITISGGSGSYPSIDWSGTDESGTDISGGLTDNVYTQSNLVAGNYTVEVTDGNGCTVTYGPIPVTDPDSPLGITVSASEPGPCYGATNGTISVTATGGVAPYASITLRRGGTVITPSSSGTDYANYINMGEGTYEAEVIDDAGNIETTTVVFDLPDELGVNVNVDQDVSCNLDADGTITFSATGGSPDDNGTSGISSDDYYDYYITPPSGSVITGTVIFNGTETINTLEAGNGYTIRIVDAEGCYVSTTFDIDEPDAITFNVDAEDLSCFGSADGRITLSNVDGGWGSNYTYDWYVYNQSTSAWDNYALDGGPAISGLSADTFRVIVSGNLHNCTSTSSNIIINEPEELRLILADQQNITTCNGDNSGEVTLRVEGGTANYDLTGSATNIGWDGINTYVATGLYGGTNTFNVQDGHGCTDSVSTDILEPEPLVVDSVDAQIECESDGSDGEVIIYVSGGTADASGDYSYRIELENQTTGNNQVWIRSSSVQPFAINDITGILPGDYNLSVSDANSSDPSGCAYTDVINLSYIEVDETITPETCKGGNDGEIDINISGGSGNYTYTWTTPSDPSFLETTQDLSGLIAGTYNLFLEDIDRGCAVNKSYVVNTGKVLSIEASVNAVSCNGGSNGAIIVNNIQGAKAPLTYYWDGVAGGDQLTNLSSGSYELVVEDADQCQVTQSFFVPQPAAIDFSLSTNLDDCTEGNYDRSVTVNGLTGGTAPYTYVWEGPGSFVENSGNISGITTGGYYEVTITDNKGCTAEDSISVYGDPVLSADVTPVQCNGGTNGIIQLDVTGGSGSYSYSWTKQGNPTYSATSKDLSGLSAGIFDVVVTDNMQLCPGAAGGNLQRSLEVTVGQPDPIVVDSYISNVTCGGGDPDGEINITAINGGAGGYTLTWSASPYITQGAWHQTDLPEGEYTVVISDNAMCYVTRTFTIEEPDPLDFTLDVTPTDCSGTNGIEITNPSGGTDNPANYEFSWAGPGIPTGFAGTSQTDLPGGEYTVTMVDVGNVHNCNISKTVTITKALDVTYSVQPEICPGSNTGAIDITPVNGVGPYSYSWSTTDGSGLSTTNEDQSGLSAGTYSVTVTDSNPEGACSVNISDIEVTEANTITVANSITHVRCLDGSTGAINIDVTGGSGAYNYNWSGPNGFTSNAEDISGLEAGSYTLVVTDVISGTTCSVTETYSVTEPADFVEVTDVVVDSIECHGATDGAIDITVTGGTSPYQFQWVGPGTISDPTNEDLTNIRSGNYNVYITDTNGCVLDYAAVYGDSINVPQPNEALEAYTVNVEDVTINGASNGSIEIEVTGGTGSYTIRWVDENDVPVAGSDDLEFVDNLSSGSYSVTITDENNCSTEITDIVVRQPGDPLDLIISKRHVGACSGSDNGVISVDMIGGTLPYQSITLFNGGGQVDQVTDDNGAVFRDLPAGDYEVVGIDANGVDIRSNVRILQPTPLVLNAAVTTHVECYSSETGVITVSVDSGIAHSTNNDYRVSLSGGPSGTAAVQNPAAATDITFNNLPAGTYTIRVIDDSNINEVVGSEDTWSAGYGDSNFDINSDCYLETQVTVEQPEAELTLSTVTGGEEICEGALPTLQLITANWDFAADGNLEVALSDGETYIVDSSPFQFEPDSVPAEGITQYTIVSVEDAANCSKGTGSGTAVVEVHPLPTATIFGDAEMCLGEARDLGIELTGSGPWNVAISDGTNTWNETFTGSFNLFEVTPTADAAYEILSVSDLYCSNSPGVGNATISVNELPEVTLTGNAEICEGGSTNLTFDLTAGTAPYEVTYEAVTSGGTTEHTVGPISTDSYNLTVSPDETTDYRLVSVEDVNGCVQSITGEVRVTVREWPGSVTGINGNDIICQGSTQVYSIDTVANATGYVWELPAGAGTIVSGQGTTSIEVDYAINAPETANLSVYAYNDCGDGTNYVLQINIDQLPQTIGAISGDEDLCQGASGVRYSVPQVDDASVYNWTVPAGFTIIDGQGSSTIEVDVDPAINTTIGNVTVTPENSCGLSTSSSSLEVEVHPLPDADAGSDQQLCGISTTLSAVDPASINANWSGQWEIISGYATIASPNDPSSALNDISRGNAVLVWTVTNTASSLGCSVSDTVVVRNNQLSVQADAEETLSCDGNTDLYGTRIPSYPNTSGRWTVESGSGSFDDANAAGTTVYDLGPGSNTLRWTLTQNTCESYAEVVVVNDQPDQAHIDQQDTIDICDTQTILTANDPVQGTGTWSVEKGRATVTATNAAGNEIEVTNLAKGENIIRWTVAKNGNCSNYDQVVIRNNQLEVEAGDPYTTCQDIIQIEGTEPPEGTTGQWSAYSAAAGQVSFADGTAHQTVVSGLIYGENDLRWTLYKNGCESSDSVTITSHTPTVATVGSEQTICNTDTILTGNDPASYETGRWTIVQGSGDFADANDPRTRVSNVGFGENIYRWTIFNGNCSSSADLIVFNQQVEAFAGKDTVSCSRYVKMNADPVPDGYTGLWTIESGAGGAVFDGSQNDPKVGVQLALGENLLRWNVIHDQSGCSTSDVVSVLINSIENVDAGGDQIINDGSGEATMQASLPNRATGEWSIVSGGGTIVDPDNAGTLIENLSRGPNVFRWTVTIGNCIAYDEVQITNGDVIQADTGPDIVTCSPETTMHANDPDNAIGRWTLGSYGSGKFENNRDPETVVYDLGPGDNEFVWTISYGQGTSYSSDTIIVTNNQPDRARAGLDRFTCNNADTLQGNTPDVNMGTVTWSIISGSGQIANPGQPETAVTGLSQGDNTFVYTIQKGSGNNVCFSSDTVVVTNGLATPAEAGEDQTLCVDSVELSPNIPNHGIGEWRIYEGAAEFDGNMARNIARGTNRFLWVVSTEYCTSVDTVVIVNNEPSLPNAGRDIAVCKDSVTLSGSLDIYHTGEWSLISGSGNLESPTEPDTKVTGLGPGNNRFRWTITNGQCSDFDDVVIRNDFKEAIIRYDATTPLCVDTTVLEANNPLPGVGTWGVVGGGGSAEFDDPEDPNTTVRGLEQGENILTWTVTHNQCVDVDYVTVINNTPSQSDAGGNVATCDNYVYLAANDPEVGNGEWTVRNGSGSFSSLSNPSARVDSLQFGANVFRWTIENEGCRSIDDVQVEFNSVPASAGYDRTICSDTEVLQGNNPSPGTGTWSVAGGTSQATFDDLNNPNTTVRNLRKGVNRLRWTINYKGCQTFEEVSITNGSPSTSYAGNTQRLCADETILDALEPEIGTGRWEIIAGSATISSEDLNNPKAPISQLAKGDNVLRWIVENDICRSEDEVLVVNNLPSTPFAGSDLEVCQPDHDLMAATPEYGDGYWSILEGGGNISDVTDPRAHIRNLSYGVTRLKWTVTKGQCTLSDEIVIENNTATQANAGPDVTDCKDWAQLDANPALRGTGEWSIVSGRGAFVNPADEATTIEELGFGENILMWEIFNGDKCFSRDTVTIFNKVPEQSDAGNDKVICDNYTTLNANNPPEEALGTWTVVSGAGEFDNPNSYSSIVRDIGFGDNVYKWTISYGDCITESTVNVVSNKTDAYAGEDLVVYDPEAMLNANNVGELDARWSIVGGSGEFEDPTFFNTQVSGLSEGVNTYRWSITVSGCSSFDDVTVEYRPVPDAGFITDGDEGCWPYTVSFTNYSVGVQNRDYHWDFGDGNTSGDQNPVHTFENPGDYPVILTVPGPDGIEGHYQKIIRVHEHPEAAFDVTPSEVYVPGDEVRFFDLSVGSEEYEWHFGDGNISTEAHPVHEYTESGVYDVMLHVTNEYGCTDSTTIEGVVTAISKGFIKFPNAFKPRPDGGVSNRPNETNNIFKPVYRDVDTYHLQIFNRWGQLIYESSDIDEGWNGFYKGQLVPQAVYVWKVSGTFVNGTEFRETGSVLLVR